MRSGSAFGIGFQGSLLQGLLCIALVAAEAHFPPISAVMDCLGNGLQRKHFNRTSFNSSPSLRGDFRGVRRYYSTLFNRLFRVAVS